MKKLFILVVLLWGSWSFADSAEDYFDKGFEAYKSQNYTQAVKLWENSCNLGNAKACNYIGILYFAGRQGIKKDHTKTAKFWKKSCDLGNAIGCKNLKSLYDKGQ